MSQKAVSVAAKTREDTATVTREHKFLVGYQGNLWVEEFRLDSTPPVGETIRVDTSGERLQGIAEGRSSAPVWPAYQPRHFPGEMSVQGPIVA